MPLTWMCLTWLLRLGKLHLPPSVFSVVSNSHGRAHNRQVTVWYVVFYWGSIIFQTLISVFSTLKKCSQKLVNVHWVYILINPFEKCLIILQSKSEFFILFFLPYLFALYILSFLYLDTFLSLPLPFFDHLCELIMSR